MGGALAIAASAAVLGMLVSACGSDHPGSPVGGNAGGASNVSGNGNSGGLHLGNLGGSMGSPTGGTGVEAPTEECAGDLVEAKPIPLDMYVMLDQSASMTLATDGDPQITKWDAVSSALIDFVNDPESAGLGVGLQLFPLIHPRAAKTCTTAAQCGAFGPCLAQTCWPTLTEQLEPCFDDFDCGAHAENGCITFGVCANEPNYVCVPLGLDCGPEGARDLGACVSPGPSECLNADDCRTATYATPAAPIAELPGAAAGIVSVIQAAQPTGATPTQPALAGAIQAASAWATAHPDHQVVAVLATDGTPTRRAGAANALACDFIVPMTEQDDLAAVYGVAAAGRSAQPAISTFVIGVLGPDDPDAPGTLNEIALSGGTEEAFIVDTTGDVNAQFRAALNEIRAGRLSCELLIPEPAAGKVLDFHKVNVVFDDGKVAGDLGYVSDESACKTDGGWHYDVDPDQGGTPTRIVACPTTCAAFGKVRQGSVAIKLGCATKNQVLK